MATQMYSPPSSDAITVSLEIIAWGDFDGYVYSTQDVIQHEISPIKPTIFDRWAEGNILQQALYETLNSFSIVAQGLNPFDNQIMSLRGEDLTGQDLSEYGANVEAFLLLVTAASGRGSRLNNLGGAKFTKTSKDLFNFGSSAAKHFANPARKVPIQIMNDVIMNTKGVPDPRGSRAMMHYSRISRNGKFYNLEILYDEMSNSIWHFKYSRQAMGPLQKIKK